MLTPTIVIGGFLFNQKPLEFILNNIPSTHFFDINILDNISSLDNIIMQLSTIIYLARSSFELFISGEPNINSNSADKINLIGYSTGGLIAVKYATLYPELVEKIILLNSTPCFIQHDLWHGIKLNDFQKLACRLDNSNLHDFIHYFIQLVNYPDKIDINSFSDNFSCDIKKSTLCSLLDIIKNTNLVTEINSLAQKILVINSQNDVLVPQNILESRQIILRNSTHFNLNNNSEYIMSLIQDFINNA